MRSPKLQNNAKVIKKGKWHYKFSHSDRNRHLLQKGPIEVSYLEGKRFLYFITDFSVFITESSNKEFLLHAMEQWEKDEQLKKLMDEKKRQEEADKQRAIPYAL
jgi:hypothetical protein